MTIYIDIIFLINFIFDFLILVFVSLILKRKTKMYRLLLGALLGSLSIFILFIKINNFTLFLIKFIISIFMIITSFGIKNFIKNYLYLYLVSIILGGTLLFINNLFSYKVDGIIFINNGFSINILLIIIISPLILYFYYKENIKYKDIYSNIYKIDLYYHNKRYSYTGYLDSGNCLKDPYLKRDVCVLFDPNIKIDRFIYIPFNMLNETGLLKGFIADKIVIDQKHEFKKVLIGLTDKNFNLEGTNIILNRSFKRHIS